MGFIKGLFGGTQKATLPPPAPTPPPAAIPPTLADASVQAAGNRVRNTAAQAAATGTPTSGGGSVASGDLVPPTASASLLGKTIL